MPFSDKHAVLEIEIFVDVGVCMSRLEFGFMKLQNPRGLRFPTSYMALEAKEGNSEGKKLALHAVWVHCNISYSNFSL